MTSSTTKLPFKAMKFLFKGTKKSGGPPTVQKGHMFYEPIRLKENARK